MAQHVAAALPIEVKIGMVGEIRDGIRAADGTVIDAQRIVVRQGKCDGYVEPAGIALFAVRQNGCEFHTVFAAGVIPELLVKAAQTAVELVFTLVGREPEALAVQREGRANF